MSKGEPYHYVRFTWWGVVDVEGFQEEFEDDYDARLVRAQAGIPVKYVMNSLQPWMTDLASRVAFIGSDGVNTEEPYLTQTIRDYERLASHAELEKFYINP